MFVIDLTSQIKKTDHLPNLMLWWYKLEKNDDLHTCSLIFVSQECKQYTQYLKLCMSNL